MSKRRNPSGREMKGPGVYLLCRIHGDHVGDIIVFPDGKVSGYERSARPEVEHRGGGWVLSVR